MISLGSGATDTSRTLGLCVKGVQAADVSDAKSRKVTNPVDDIGRPTTPSNATSIKKKDSVSGKKRINGLFFLAPTYLCFRKLKAGDDEI
jgi:hypothetical protein